MLVCPVCHEKIEKTNNKVYTCCNHHCFDISKKGYVNFLLCQNKHSKLPGDNQLMVDAREQFLKQGYYNCFSEELENLITSLSPRIILDAGCGEGYYTNRIYQNNRTVIGIDISKTALAKAAPKNRSITYIAASLFDLPIADKSIDCLFSLFAPYAGNEFYRVLKEDGYMILGIPGANHLFELKAFIYPTPYKNQVKPYELDNFSFIKAVKVNQLISLHNKEDILNLFKMTPYYYRTKKEDLDKIYSLETFDVTISFELLLYQKKK